MHDCQNRDHGTLHGIQQPAALTLDILSAALTFPQKQLMSTQAPSCVSRPNFLGVQEAARIDVHEVLLKQ